MPPLTEIASGAARILTKREQLAIELGDASTTSIHKLIEAAWTETPFRGLAEKSANAVTKGRARDSRELGAWSDLRVHSKAGGEVATELPPALAALIKGDKSIWAPKSQFGNYLAPENQIFNEHSLKQLSEKIGLRPNSLFLDESTGKILLRVTGETPIAAVDGVQVAQLSKNQAFGVASGYLADRKAYEALLNRYTARGEVPTVAPYPKGDYRPSDLRALEDTLGLKQGSLIQANGEISVSNSSVRNLNIRGALLDPRPESQALQSTATVTRVSGEEALDFSVAGKTFRLQDREGSAQWFYPAGWKGAGRYGDSDFKLRLIGPTGQELNRVQEVFIPRMFEDGEFKALVNCWKTVNPQRSGLLRGQNGKALTFYPASDDAVLPLAHKLDQIIRNEAPDLILKSRFAATTDRFIGSTNRLALTREAFPATSDKLISMGEQFTKSVKTDAELPRTDMRGKLVALAELTGIRPGELVSSKEGLVAIAGSKSAAAPGKLYLKEGTPAQRGFEYNSDRGHTVVSQGYTGRWAVNIASARYNIDPLSFPLSWKF